MKNKNRIQLLDCTLRDGGLGLYDAYTKGFSNLKFNTNFKKNMVNLLTKSNINLIELGSIELSKNNNEDFAIYQNIEDVSKKIPQTRQENQLFAALYRGPDTPEKNIPKWEKGLCEINRVIIRYSEMQKSLDFCTMLAEKGYKVCVQPMLTMRYTNEEIENLINVSNKINAYALYFVDSYGYMTNNEVNKFYETYNAGLKSEIRIGFHAHSNMNLAFSNVLNFINNSSQRNILVDSCIMGLGQGAGNLQTEIITNEINNNYEGEYNYNAVLEACEELNPYFSDNLCGYSVTNLLPAINHVAYKYAADLRKKCKLSYVEINRMLKNIPEEFRHRYTNENLISLLKMFNHEDLIKE